MVVSLYVLYSLCKYELNQKYIYEMQQFNYVHNYVTSPSPLGPHHIPGSTSP